MAISTSERIGREVVTSNRVLRPYVQHEMEAVHETQSFPTVRPDTCNDRSGMPNLDLPRSSR